MNMTIAENKRLKPGFKVANIEPCSYSFYQPTKYYQITMSYFALVFFKFLYIVHLSNTQFCIVYFLGVLFFYPVWHEPT